MSDLRRERVRLEISREAARLFWDQGVAATSGEQIAEAVGLSVRTIWRHFRSKESCAEPIVSDSVEWFLGVMRRWPRQLTLATHLARERAAHDRGPEQLADDALARKMIVLAETEPAIRSAWLMACHHVEVELASVLADRLDRPADDPELRLHAASATAVVRVISEQLHAALLRGDDAAVADLDERLARSVRVATGGAVGGAVRS